MIVSNPYAFRTVNLRAGVYILGEILVEYEDGTVGAFGGIGTMSDIAGYAGTGITQISAGLCLIHCGIVAIANDTSSPVIQEDVALKSGAKKIYVGGAGANQKVSAASFAGALELKRRPWGISTTGLVELDARPGQ